MKSSVGRGGRLFGVVGVTAALVAGGSAFGAFAATGTAATAATTTASTTRATVAATTAATVTIDDTATRGVDSFVYTGSWQTCTRCLTAGFGGSFHVTKSVGAGVRLVFDGTRAVIYGPRQAAGGVAAVTLDGRAAGTVDVAATVTSLGPIYTTPVLRAGQHTVVLTVSSRSGGRGHTLGIDRAVITGPVSAPAPSHGSTTHASEAVASLSFDDGQVGQFENAEPLLRAAGVHATFYIISDGMTWGPPQMSVAQVAQLAKDGEEIGDHTRDHAVLATLTDAQVEAEFSDAQAAFRAKLGITPTTCAYPEGAVTAAIEKIAAKYFTACRGTAGGINGTTADRYDLAVFYLQSTTTVAEIKEAVQEALSTGGWIIFVHHGIGTGGTVDDITTAQFRAELDAIKSSGIRIETVAQAYASHH